MDWYLHDDYRVDNIPAGHTKLLFVGDLPDRPAHETARPLLGGGPPE